MKTVFQYSIICGLCGLLATPTQAQCLSELLFLKAPDTLCTNRKELVLKTSKAKESNVQYVWRLPNGTTTITNDSILTIAQPQVIHSGNYAVSTRKDNCTSKEIGPVKVNIIGTATFVDTVKQIRVCKDLETELTSKFKVGNGILGEWKAAEGVVIGSKNVEKSTFKNLSIGKNLVVWILSTDKCKDLYRDSFFITVEAKPFLTPQTFDLRADNASITLPLATIKGANLNLIDDITIKITQPKSGKVDTLGKSIKYTRKVGFSGLDKFSLEVCNNRCPNFCSAPTNFQILVEFEERYPNVTIPKVLSPNMPNFSGLDIENVRSYPQNELIILDRWGGQIEKFINYPEDKKINNKNWDGTKSGKLLPAGAYYFVFQAKKDISTPPNTDFRPISGIFYIVD